MRDKTMGVGRTLRLCVAHQSGLGSNTAAARLGAAGRACRSPSPISATSYYDEQEEPSPERRGGSRTDTR